MASPTCTTACPAETRRSHGLGHLPSFTHRNVQAALDWLADAFGPRPRVVGQQPGGQIQHAAVAHGNGMVLIVSDRPAELHGSHTGKGWVYVAIDAHYQQAKRAGACASESGGRNGSVRRV